MARPTQNDQIDSILYGNLSWGIDTLTYVFDNSYYRWTNAAKDAFRDALESWSDVADIDFDETFFVNSANLIESFVDDAQMSALVGGSAFGAHEVPFYTGFDDWLQGWYNWESFGWPGPDGYDVDSLGEGGLGRSVFVHEIGHALGLAHPHDADGPSVRMPGVSSDNDLGTHKLNQGVFTVMSYNDGWVGQDPWGKGFNDRGYNSGPGALDIAAIQYLYGADTSNNGGNSVYKLTGKMGWSAIWDTGGIDRIVHTGSQDAVINLRAATLDEGPNSGGYLSYLKGSGNFGGFTIAGDFTNALANKGAESDVIIENATGGSGDDSIVGNNVRNVLNGGGGHDRIAAAGGTDRVLGGTGNDDISGGGSHDKLYGQGGHDTIDGDNGNDQLFGSGGNDVLRGGQGIDVLNGGGGADILRGGGGNDRFIFKDGAGVDKIVDYRKGFETLSLDDALWAGTNGIDTAQDVVDAFARVNSEGHVVFRFDGGDRLVLLDVGNLNGLAGDISII